MPGANGPRNGCPIADRLTERLTLNRGCFWAAKLLEQIEVMDFNSPGFVPALEETLASAETHGTGTPSSEPEVKKAAGKAWKPPSRAAWRAEPSSAKSNGCTSTQPPQERPNHQQETTWPAPTRLTPFDLFPLSRTVVVW